MRAGHLSPSRTHVPRTSARRSTNQEVNVLDDCYRGKGRCRGDKCQITHGVSAYDESAEIDKLSSAAA